MKKDIKAIIKEMMEQKAKTRMREIEQIKKIYGDKWHSEGLSDIRRKIELEEEIFKERFTKDDECEKT